MVSLDLNKFRNLYDQKVAEKPKIFQLVTPDPLANDRQISTVEDEIGVMLPASYRSFLKEFGGGTFGFTNIFSANPDSEYYIVSRNDALRGVIPDDLIAFSDDHCGGLYMFATVNGLAHDAVFYWNADGGCQTTDIDNLFEFVARFAFDRV